MSPGKKTELDLRGELCNVRSWRKTDLASLVRHANNINVARHLRDRFPHPYTRSDGLRFLASIASAPAPTTFAIVAEGEACGGIGLVRGTDVERFSAEIGYWLAEPFWGRGIVTEAVRLLTAYAFADLGLLRVFALPFAENLSSVRVLEKAGYQREGLLKSSSVKYGTPRDQLLYARLNEAWQPESR